MSDDGLDLDAELLALAGDESGGEQEHDATHDDVQASRSPSPRSSPQRSSRHSSPAQSPPRRGPSSRKMKLRKAGGRRRKDDSEEEGEASSAPGSPDSLGSGAMEESDSEAGGSDADGEDRTPYPIEGKFTSYEDKARILGLSEIERESILAERAAEMERRNQDLNLKRLMQGRQANRDEKKRKAAAADLDDSERKARKPKGSEKLEKLEAYKRQREQTREQRSRRDRDRDHRSPSRDDRDLSDADADGDSEVEWDNSRGKDHERHDPPPDLKDFERVRIGRSNFAKVCFYPGFEDALTGCFCRVSIGVDKSTGQSVYRMCQIKGFTEGTPYTMQGSNGKPIKTDQYALVAHGKAEKEWPFIMCSDSRFSDSEFNRYKVTAEGDGVKIPTKKKLLHNLENIHRLLDRRWTEEEVAEKLRRQNKFAAEKTGVTKSTPTVINRQGDRLAALNNANRKKNAQEVRQALIAQHKAKAAAAAKAKAKKEEEERKKLLEVPGTGDLDALFDGSDLSRSGTPANGEKKSPGKKVEKKGLPTFKKRTMDDDLIGAMDLGIDVEI
ncbi:uncharacterized protein K452DRAFT_258026 [Aplosporella prunicola CBS 121167]|uniref:Plus3 domain-containing protein n=1 Tax=Aplosporella prunicola CBS 121167 TaxID=1176127 RepID=A0A6A6B1K5_9PEZI|nr:uncharacterized protein K452DRAFT_258026 [Aplosporella prunicola CBS 121167]KAF2137253.1 hypothetical protein K452DRAFT_258026 [Aplosporella prunicola CBS 121167]